MANKRMSEKMVQVKTAQYQMAHGKKPRGYGNWAFCFGSDSFELGKTLFIVGYFSDAVKKAKIKAADVGISSITVGS